MGEKIDTEVFKERHRLKELRVEHRDLDAIISQLDDTRTSDQLQIRRLKKRKLVLRDQITKLESQLIPDLNA